MVHSLRPLAALATLGLAAAAGAASAAHGRAADAPSEAERSAIFALSPLGAPPPDPTDAVAQSPAAQRLGQYLFFDAKLSANGKISCASCHQPARAFTDGRARAQGLALGTRNTPTLLDAAFNHWFFLDGRADSLWSQPLQVFENPKEMGSDRLHVVHSVYADPAVRRAYEGIFGPMPALGERTRFPAHARPDADPKAPVARAWRAMAPADRVAANRAFSNIGKALEAYVRELVSRDSPFDRYVAALRKSPAERDAALSPAAVRGMKLFVGAAHCNLCHSGPDFSDGEFHNLGLPAIAGSAPDPGRAAAIARLRANPFNGAGAYSDDPGGDSKERLEYLPPAAAQLGKFRTPTLRDVSLTAPYMHDGRFATLREVLQFYAEGKAASRGHVLGTREATLDLIPRLTPHEISDLAAFLESLAGAPLAPALTRPVATP